MTNNEDAKRALDVLVETCERMFNSSGFDPTNNRDLRDPSPAINAREIRDAFNQNRNLDHARRCEFQHCTSRFLQVPCMC